MGQQMLVEARQLPKTDRVELCPKMDFFDDSQPIKPNFSKRTLVQKSKMIKP